MKHQAINLVKFKALSRRLKLPLYQTVGLLESLWLFCQIQARDGDLSRFSPLEIAAWLEWEGDEQALIDALVETRWLDREGDELSVHDWQDHRPNWLKAIEKRRENNQLSAEPSSEPGSELSGEPSSELSAEPGEPYLKPKTYNLKPTVSDDKKNPSDSSPQSEAPRTQEPALTEFVFPVVGKGPDHWTLPLADLQEFRKAYPIDIEAEMRKAAVWLRSNPQRRKTARGMMRFLNAWLEKAVNRASGLAMAGSKPKPESRVPTLEDLENYRPYGPD